MDSYKIISKPAHVCVEIEVNGIVEHLAGSSILSCERHVVKKHNTEDYKIVCVEVI